MRALHKEKQVNSSDAALHSISAITSIGIVTLQMLETLLPATAEEIEQQSLRLSNDFQIITDYLATRELPADVHQAIHGIVFAMQFQDRNTQIMETIVSILQRYRAQLEDIRSTIDVLGDGHAVTDARMDAALGTILSSIHLNDIRTRYVEALKKANIHVASMGTTTTEELTGSIELF